MGIIKKASKLVSEVKEHWREPSAGNFIPYREFAAYGVGGVGISTINSLFAYCALSANCLLMGSVYGIRPTHLAYMSVIMGIINILKAPFISMLIDNTNSKFGKFRPYLLYTGIPSVVMLIYMTFIPINSGYWTKCIVIGTVYALLMTFQSLYSTAFSSLAQVMTPNGGERTTLLSVSSFIFNLGPSLVNIILPVTASLISPDGMRDITVYRVIFPILSIAGVILGMWTFKGTNERLIVPSTYVAKVRFRDGLSQAAKNKYFWIINLSAVFGGLKTVISSTLAWYCVYVLQKDAVLGIMNAVIGTASVPGMLLAPILAKKLGKRNVQIVGNAIHLVFALLMLFTMKTPVLFFACLYLSTLGIGAEYVITQSMFADVYDYQQLKSGTRLEGFMSQLGGQLTTICGLGTGLILPYFYEHYGLGHDYNVLFETAVREPIFRVIIIVAVISSLLAIVPYIFYDLTEKKHEEIIYSLRLIAEKESKVKTD